MLNGGKVASTFSCIKVIERALQNSRLYKNLHQIIVLAGDRPFQISLFLASNPSHA